MKVCSHQGLVIAVLTRNEQCPPHVHVGTADWDARFLFSFWHNDVRLWDVVPTQNEPSAVALEALRRVLKQPENLRRARELRWRSSQTVCLGNQSWDLVAREVVGTKDRRLGASAVLSARFDAEAYKTILQLARPSSPLEIEL
jgi:hypothetical protein